MKYLKSWGSKLGRCLGKTAIFIIEVISGTTLSIFAFASLFLFDVWWKGVLTAVGFLFLMGIIFSICAIAKGER